MQTSSIVIAARRSRALLMASAALSIAGAAAAQQPAAQAATTPGARSGDELATSIGEVVVTARRRAESVQDVPVAVDVVSGQGAQAHNLNDVGDIAQIVPSVDFRTGASNKDRTIFIRGVGTISTSPGVEPSVSTVVDGVVMTRPGMATFDLVDLDHIEVLEGPQGTLFGKNASAGVVNIVTSNPTDTPKGHVEFGYYEGQEFRTSFGVSGPIIGDKLEALTSFFDAQYRGNVENIYGGVDKPMNGYRHDGGRIKVIARPSDDLKLTVNADYTNSADSVPTGVFVSAGHIAYPSGVFGLNQALANSLAAAGVNEGPDNRTVSQNTASSVHDKNGGVSLQADLNLFDGYTLTSITAWREWTNIQYQDYDELGQPSVGLAQGADTGRLKAHQTSQEVRLASPKGKFIDYVVGVYALRATDDESYQRVVQTVASAGASPVTNSGLAHYGTIDDNIALFGEANINLTKQLRLIAGYRYIVDDLSYYHNRVSTAPTTGVAASVVNPVPGGPSPSDHVSSYSDRFGVQYDVTPHIMAYFTYSRGYKGPAYNVFFNMAAVNEPALAPETSNDYELGLKTTLFDERVRANVTGFIDNFQNYQANFTQSVNGGLVTNLINAGTVSTKGVEFDVTAKPTTLATLNANLLWDDAKVDNFYCPPNAASSCNINGQPLPFAPRWKLHLGGDYKVWELSAWDVQLESDYNYQSKTQYSLSETADTIQPAYGIWNADVALLGHTNGWQARFLVKNILNQHYSPYLAYGALGGVVRFVPRDDNRYIGVNLRRDF